MVATNLIINQVQTDDLKTRMHQILAILFIVDIKNFIKFVFIEVMETKILSILNKLFILCQKMIFRNIHNKYHISYREIGLFLVNPTVQIQ